MRQFACGILAVVLAGCGGAGAPPATAVAPPEQWTAGLSGDAGDHALTTWFESRGAEIHVYLEGSEPKVGRQNILAWVERAADAVGQFYGRYPVRRASIVIHSTGLGTVEGGKAFDGKRIDVQVGAATTERDLRDDWIMTHEMFHLGFPDLGERYLWMNEGLSDYLEPVARARAGQIPVKQVWKEWAEGFPDGLPGPGDRGLDNTHTWGRTYWGGTIFWLMADMRIRQQTSNRKSLDDAIKSILSAGGDGSQTWAVNRVIDFGDRATGTGVLRELHDEMGGRPVSVDLAALWKQLGVRYARGRVTFDDSAPLAGIRQGITSPHH